MSEALDTTPESKVQHIIYWAMISCESGELAKFRVSAQEKSPHHYADFRFILDDLDVEMSFQELKELLLGHMRLIQHTQQSFIEQQKRPQ